MRFPFYPKHEHGCQFIKCCPHVGGASLATLVLAATDQTELLSSLHRVIDSERERYGAVSYTHLTLPTILLV